MFQTLITNGGAITNSRIEDSEEIESIQTQRNMGSEVAFTDNPHHSLLGLDQRGQHFHWFPYYRVIHIQRLYMEQSCEQFQIKSIVLPYLSFSHTEIPEDSLAILT